MKFKLLTFIAVLAASAAALTAFNSCNAQEKKENIMPNDKKVLIAYYSLSGNTKDVAEAIRSKTGGDIFRIETVQSYPEEYRATTAQAKREINEGFRPELKGKIDNIAQYDIIFIGSPNWWGTIAPAVSSFLADYDLKGKTVIPFITHGGGGVQNTITDLTAQCNGCSVKQNGWVGYGIWGSKNSGYHQNIRQKFCQSAELFFIKNPLPIAKFNIKITLTYSHFLKGKNNVKSNRLHFSCTRPCYRRIFPGILLLSGQIKQQLRYGQRTCRNERQSRPCHLEIKICHHRQRTRSGSTENYLSGSRN